MSPPDDATRTHSSGDAVVIPGARDVRGTLDRAGPETRDGAGSRDDTVVVACPPHPQYGGSRSDHRLRTVSERLRGRGVDCLRFDYGPWAEGTGERADLRAALSWAGERYDRVGVFGYSFGGAVAIAVAGDHADGEARPPAELAALCALSPARVLPDGVDVPAAIPEVTTPAGLVYGSRDTTVEWEPTVAAARRAGWQVTELAADHRFTGMQGAAADAVVDTLWQLLE